jgi:hypothetical protein
VAARAASSGQTDQTRDFGTGPAEWSAWYTDYLTRSSAQSAKTLKLFQEVLECVSRGDLSPTAFQDLLPTFAQARGTEYLTKLSALTSRFFTGLVQIGATWSQEQAELLMPGFSISELSPPQFDLKDPIKWFQQLTDYTAQLSTRALKAYQSGLERMATGAATPHQFQQPSSDYLAYRLPQHLHNLGRLYFDLLNGLNDLRAAYEEDYLSGLLATARRHDKEAPLVVNLAGPIGDTASASLSLANTRREPSLIRCTFSDVRRADGVGPAFGPKIVIAPEALQLQPNEEGSVRLSLRLDEADYDADVLYTGAVRVTDHGETRLELPLRITATRPANSEKS